MGASIFQSYTTILRAHVSWIPWSLLSFSEGGTVVGASSRVSLTPGRQRDRGTNRTADSNASAGPEKESPSLGGDEEEEVCASPRPPAPPSGTDGEQPRARESLPWVMRACFLKDHAPPLMAAWVDAWHRRQRSQETGSTQQTRRIAWAELWKTGTYSSRRGTSASVTLSFIMTVASGSLRSGNRTPRFKGSICASGEQRNPLSLSNLPHCHRMQDFF